MSKIKEIQIDCRLSHQYNSFGCSETIVIEEGDDENKEKLLSASRCKKHCEQQIRLLKEDM